jgi:endogenous inhibitor of DNA gyrase (YacG/DUF329 family)
MFKEENICPNCDEQYILVRKENKSQFCPFCGDPVIEDERGELDMGEAE